MIKSTTWPAWVEKDAQGYIRMPLKKKYRTHREFPHWVGKAGYGGRKGGVR